MKKNSGPNTQDAGVVDEGTEPLAAAALANLGNTRGDTRIVGNVNDDRGQRAAAELPKKKKKKKKKNIC
jgi:hypothetical protein